MTTTTSGTPDPTWYDVLGVDRDATPEEIKAAWRAATDRFEPGSGSGQFRMFNDAAEVLLDPVRRRAYDASLGTGRPASRETTETNQTTESSGATRVDLDEAAPAPAAHPTEEGTAEDTDETAETAETRAPAARRRRFSRRSTPARAEHPAQPASRATLVAALVVLLLTVAAVVTAAILGLRVREDARVADARDEAPAAAERAAKAMLSYDYRQLPTDRKRAAVYLTDDFKKKYLTNFALLEKQKDGTPGAAVQTKSVVTASVLGSGVVDAQEDVVRVLVYVNQVSKKPKVDPQIFQNRVSMTMEKNGNRWLVSNLKSY